MAMAAGRPFPTNGGFGPTNGRSAPVSLVADEQHERRAGGQNGGNRQQAEPLVVMTPASGSPPNVPRADSDQRLIEIRRFTAQASPAACGSRVENISQI